MGKEEMKERRRSKIISHTAGYGHTHTKTFILIQTLKAHLLDEDVYQAQDSDKEQP